MASKQISSDVYETKCKFIPLQHNPLPVPIEQVIKLAPTDFDITAPKTLDGDKAFYDYFWTVKGEPLSFLIRGRDLELGTNKQNGKLEFKLDLTSNGYAQHAMTVLAGLINEQVTQTYCTSNIDRMAVVVRSPMYKCKVTLPWAHSFGKYLPIEVKTRQVTFACSPDLNIDALNNSLKSHAGGEFDVRVVMKPWLMFDKEANLPKAGFKLHVQQIVMH